jgi:hypothetical protein
VNQLKELPFTILAVIPGAETGVELADQLSHRLALRSNGVEQSVARRNKYHMGEAVRNAGYQLFFLLSIIFKLFLNLGVRAVKQQMCHSLSEMFEFLKTIATPFQPTQLKCVVKPVQSAGTDDVFLCNTKEEAETAFNRIIGKINGLGLLNSCVLVQEFLVGKEYVVDKVSRDGVHKLVAIWEYDKRSINDAHFVYFGMRLQSPTTPMAKVGLFLVFILH